jgi:hypothetical protein
MDIPRHSCGLIRIHSDISRHSCGLVGIHFSAFARFMVMVSHSCISRGNIFIVFANGGTIFPNGRTFILAVAVMHLIGGPMAMCIGAPKLTMCVICGTLAISPGSLILTVRRIHHHAGSCPTLRVCAIVCGPGRLLTECFFCGLLPIYATGSLLTVHVVIICHGTGNLLTVRDSIVVFEASCAGSLLLTDVGTDFGLVVGVIAGFNSAGSLLTMRFSIFGLMHFCIFGLVPIFVFLFVIIGLTVMDVIVVTRPSVGLIGIFIRFFTHSCGGASISLGSTV